MCHFFLGGCAMFCHAALAVRLCIVLWLLLCPALAWSQTQHNLHTTLPNVLSFTFPSQLQTFLYNEDAARFADMQTGFVVSGGIGATAGTKTMAAFAATGYTGSGFYTSQASASIDLGASPGPACADNDTAWIILTKDSTSTPGGSFVRVSGTRYAVDCTSATRPALPSTDACWLMQATIGGGAITAVTDLADRVFVGQQTFAESRTIGAGVRWAFLSGAYVTIASGHTLTMASCPEAGKVRIFDADESTTGAVRFSTGTCPLYYPEWWGAVGDGSTSDRLAMRAAIRGTPASGALELSPRTYALTSWTGEQRSSALVLRGGGKNVTTLIGASGENLLDMRSGASLDMSGLTFTTGRAAVLYSNTTSVVDHIHLRDVASTGSFLLDFNNTTGEAGVLNATLKDAKCTDLDRDCYLLRVNVAEQVLVDNLECRDLVASGNPARCVMVGTNETTFDHRRKEIRVVNSIFDTISSDADVEVHAVQLHATDVVVSGNIVHNVSGVNEAEGIYTKCTYCTISDNELFNAGTGQGAIAVKGTNRGAASGAFGFARVITGNTIRFDGTLSPPVAERAIHIDTCDTLVANNYLEGAGRGNAIMGEAPSSGTCKQNVVSNNIIYNWNKAADVTFSERFMFGPGNHVYLIAGTTALDFDTPNSGAMTDLVIKGNYFRALTGDWLTVTRSGATLSGVYIQDNTVVTIGDDAVVLSGAMTNVDIRNNRLTGLVGDSLVLTTVTCNDIVMFGNEGGFKNVEFGGATLLAANTSVTVTHGLTCPLTDAGEMAISVTPRGDWGNCTNWWFDTGADSTQFIIRCDVAPGADMAFRWRVSNHEN